MRGSEVMLNKMSFGAVALRSLFIAVAAVGAFGVSVARASAPTEPELQAVESELNTLGTRIQRLQDLTEVEIVQNAYGYYVDKAQWRSLADLFAEDATLEIGGKGVFTGKKRVVEYMNVGL